MKVKDALDWINFIAPFDTAEDFDNVGLILGDESAEVTRVLFALDVTENVAREAVSMGAELVVVHHPMLFAPIKRIDYTAVEGRLLISLMSHRINVIAAHTNWDKAEGGVSDALAEALGLENVSRLSDYARMGELPDAISAEALSERIKAVMGVEPRRFGECRSSIKSLAVAGGAYGVGANQAASAGADAFLVGEIHHHEILEACANGLTVYDGGHYFTEMPGVKALYKRYIADAHKAGLTAEARLCDRCP